MEITLQDEICIYPFCDYLHPIVTPRDATNCPLLYIIFLHLAIWYISGSFCSFEQKSKILKYRSCEISGNFLYFSKIFQNNFQKFKKIEIFLKFETFHN